MFLNFAVQQRTSLCVCVYCTCVVYVCVCVHACVCVCVCVWQGRECVCRGPEVCVCVCVCVYNPAAEQAFLNRATPGAVKVRAPICVFVCVCLFAYLFLCCVYVPAVFSGPNKLVITPAVLLAIRLLFFLPLLARLLI